MSRYLHTRESPSAAYLVTVTADKGPGHAGTQARILACYTRTQQAANADPGTLCFKAYKPELGA